MPKILNKVHLQIIAATMMFVDHLAWIIFPGYPTQPLPIILHILGRLAFPIFAYFIAEGYHYTHDKKKYALRIFLLAIISHVPYMMASLTFQNYGWLSLIPFATGKGVSRFLNQGSVLFSYFIGLIMLYINDSTKLKEWQKALFIFLLCFASFPCDWSSIGSLVVLSIGSNRGKPIKQLIWSFVWVTCYALVYIFALDVVYGLIQFGTILVVPLLSLYNGMKSRSIVANKIAKYFLYIFYPFHLLVLGLIALFL